MRHRKKVKRLGLRKDHRESLLKNLVASLVLNGSLRTTRSRAKALSARFAKLMRHIQKKEKREAIRIIPRYCFGEQASRKLVGEFKVKYESRTSGFTRITPVGMRKGDNAHLVKIELI